MLCLFFSTNPSNSHALGFHSYLDRKIEYLSLISVSDSQNGSRWQVFQDVLSPDQENLDLANVNLMLELLVQKKKQLEAVSKGKKVIAYVF